MTPMQSLKCIIRNKILNMPKELPPGTYNMTVKDTKVSQTENVITITYDVERVENVTTNAR